MESNLVCNHMSGQQNRMTAKLRVLYLRLGLKLFIFVSLLVWSGESQQLVSYGIKHQTDGNMTCTEKTSKDQKQKKSLRLEVLRVLEMVTGLSGVQIGL